MYSDVTTLHGSKYESVKLTVFDTTKTKALIIINHKLIYFSSNDDPLISKLVWIYYRYTMAYLEV